MLKQTIVRFDSNVTQWVQRIPHWWRTPMVVMSAIGQPVTLIAVAMTVIMWAQPFNTPIASSMIAGLVAMAVCGVVKHFVRRSRPDTLYVSNMYFKSSSFPSGHAFGATVILGLIANMITHHPSFLQYVAPGFIGLLIAGIGVSRIYLGAHFPTDVLAGWIVGFFVLAGIIVVCGI